MPKSWPLEAMLFEAGMTEGATAAGAAVDGPAPNVNLTFDSSDGMIPGSGSSVKGLGKVVKALMAFGRPVTGAGRAGAKLGPSAAPSMMPFSGDDGKTEDYVRSSIMLLADMACVCVCARGLEFTSLKLMERLCIDAH
jgi:hypothetical protein